MPVRIFYFSVVGFLVGVLLATFGGFTWASLAFWVLLSGLGGLFWYRSKLLGEAATGWLLIGVFLLTVSLGAWRMEVAENKFGHSTLAEKVGEEVELKAVVVDEPDQRENNLRLFVEVGEDKILVTTDRYARVFYGDKVVVTGTLSVPENFVTEFGRTFNYTGYLMARGVEYQIAFADVVVEESGLGNPLITGLLRFKSSFMDKLESVLTEPAAGLGEGLLLGVKQALGEELENAFRETGIIHIVVLSGYNVMLVVAFVMFVLGYFLSRFWRAVFGILAITSFALLVGLSATVVRASIMAGLLLVAMATGRLYLVLRALLLAGLVMVLINPFLLVYDTGFQLSFLATLGLILIAPIFDKGLEKVSNIGGWKLFVIATVATQIAVTPFLLYQIGQLSVVSVVVNLLVLPMVPVAMLLTFITGLTAFVSVKLALLMAYPTYWSLTYINSIALWFAGLSFSAYVVPSFSFAWVALAYALLGTFLWWLYKKYDFSFQVENIIGKNNLVDKSEADDVLAGWVIEEEKEESEDGEGREINKKGEKGKVSEKGSDAKRPTPQEDIPIFFR